MSGRPVHYEVFSRRTPGAAWTLQMASEDRAVAIAAAEEMLTSRHACAIRVTKEILDPETGDYSSATILNKGMVEDKKVVRRAPETDAACTSPQDLYSFPAREKIARLLEDWLRRQKVTAFELLHRPDLARKLDDSGNELQHALQKLSVAEAQDTGHDLHELMRRWQALIDRAITRLTQDGGKKLFPDIGNDFKAAVDQAASHTEKTYALGGAIAKALASDTTAAAKLQRLLDMAQQVVSDPGRAWALAVIEAPAVELFAQKTTMSELLGDSADLGAVLSAMTVMAAGPQVELVAQRDAGVAKLLPPATGMLAGYGTLIATKAFPTLATQLSRRLMQDLKGPRRLRPDDPESEIATLRALALCLTVGGEDAQREDVHEAFTERSRMLVSADFVEALARKALDSCDEIEKLIWLGENVVGGANKRQAARWLVASLGALKFERALRDPIKPAPHRLAWLADMQRRVAAVQFPEKDCEEINAKLGTVGGQVANDVHLVANIVKSPMPVMQKLQVLLNLASGRAAPTGPAADGARSEVMRLLRNPDLRNGLAANPQALAVLRPMMKAAGLAA